MDPRFDPVAVLLADGQQLDPVAEITGEIDVDGRNRADPFRKDILEFDAGAEAEGEEEAELVGSVDPFDIEGRVRLGIAQLLAFFSTWSNRHRPGSSWSGYSCRCRSGYRAPW